MEFDLQALGHRMQQMRTERGLTLQELATRSTVSISMLSAVERAAKAPTIIVLARIADGLGVPLAHLVVASDQERLVVRRSTEQDVTDHPAGWRRAILSPVVPGVNFELIRTTLPPGCDAGSFPAYAAGSHEYLAVESGRLSVTVGEVHIALDAGDSVYFAADVVHGYANPSAQHPCTYYVAALIMRPR
ncbi:XRE family transcriptional regulator [Actinomadura sp. KC06]|uniref:helix-turn-helix domain-containing protein n=1 Tax=Actinomadura sp. KC06 TaxID=2530369 RepID=UPI00104C55E6|nr:XRE family transcriptional regulator [Actinomadura sp. KC06]TDD33157.1 XRE family transcriptional regulator [Actinomadura sp. KC06]